MGRQSARLWYRGKDHKDIYFQGHYHDKMYLGSTLLWEKLPGDLAIRKVAEETDILTIWASNSGRYLYYVKYLSANDRCVLYRIDLKTGQKTNCFTFGSLEIFYQDYIISGRDGIGMIIQRLSSHGTYTPYDYIMSAYVFMFDMDSDPVFIRPPYTISAGQGYDFGSKATLDNIGRQFRYQDSVINFGFLYKIENHTLESSIKITYDLNSGVDWNKFTLHNSFPGTSPSSVNNGTSDTVFWGINGLAVDYYDYDDSDPDNPSIDYDQNKSFRFWSGCEVFNNEIVEEIHNVYYTYNHGLLWFNVDTKDRQSINNISDVSGINDLFYVSFNGRYILYKSTIDSKDRLHDKALNQSISLQGDYYRWRLLNNDLMFRKSETAYQYQQQTAYGTVTNTVYADNVDFYVIEYINS